MPTTAKDLLEAANAAVPRIGVEDARKLVTDGNALVVDVRDGTEVAKSGKLKGAVHVSRGMLEFKADPETAYHDAAFQKDRPVILYCGSGGRAALAGKTLKDMGYQDVRNLGGFKDAADAGFDTEPA
jgi:rhodanese-related sulfurtransferase